MKDNDNIKELFSEKLGNFESQVNPEMWTKISSQLGSASTAAVGGLSVLSKVIIGAAAISVIAVTTVLVLNTPKEVDEKVVSTAITQDSINDVKTPDTLSEETDLDVAVPTQNETPNIILPPVAPDEYIIPEIVREIPQEQNFIGDVPLIKATEKPNPVERREEKKEKEESAKESEQDKKEEITNPSAESNQQPGHTLGTLPNVFTPNGDGQNDYLFITSSGLEDFTFVVLDSKQQVVYETSDVNFKWDGITRQGSPIEDGIYSYYFIARDKLGNTVKKFMKLSVYR